MAALTIGELAKRAGIGVETVRFYERQGLVQEPPRTGSGYRQYPEETVARLRFILRAKELGFSLREIHELISLRLDPAVPCAEVRAHASAKIADIDARLRDLTRMRASLAELVEACGASGEGRECPILDALNDNGGESDDG
ncbi:MAG TPA: MerR family DNA-binding protein [Longimicrobiaceae bacterium]|nr:MerR family DNA-binding protein [Longimicrobiaceae bacterium]